MQEILSRFLFYSTCAKSCAASHNSSTLAKVVLSVPLFIELLNLATLLTVNDVDRRAGSLASVACV